jgi:Ca-activated chloride channel family protein
VLLILDGSKSMNDDAGDGHTRLEAAKAALHEVIPALPDDAKVGLRVYGSKVSEASRAAGCRDTELVSPVGPLDRQALQSRVDALQGKGRTPIGRSLLAARGDLPKSGVRAVVLVSDGGDNCAPPNPCKAAAQVARGGVDLSISVVGLQVDARVRRQLKCIAAAGGGAYVDADDPDALRDELLAALARAFRNYDPTGTAVQGGASADQAPLIGQGQYLDHLRPGDERFYGVKLAPGQKLFASVTAVPGRTLNGSAGFRARLISPDGQEGSPGTDVLRDDRLGQFGTISTFGLRTDQAAAPGIRTDVKPGVWKVGVQLDAGDLGAKDIPVELAIQTLDPNQPPGLAREPGAPGQPAPSATPTPSATPARSSPAAEDDGGGGGALAAVGGGGLLAGLLGGFFATRRRRP